MNTAKILIIEDENPIRELISEILECYDFKTIEADNGKQGVEKALKERPDLIVCDIMMPQLDGYGVLTELQRYPQTSRIPLIFLTAKASKENMRLGMNLGADDYITKPFSQDDLVQAIQSRLNRQAVIQQSYAAQVQQVNRKAHYYLYHHPITQLPNQFSLRQLFDQTITKLYSSETEITQTEKILPFAYLKLDHFPEICETLNHQEIDKLLHAIAKRFKDSVSQNVAITHINTDEFIILMEGVKYQQQADSQAQHFLTVLADPFILNEQEIFVSASIGVAFYPSHGSTLESLVNKSRSAIKRVQNLGGNQYQRYLPAFYLDSQNQQKRADIEKGLHYAIERNELELYYQPRVDLATGKITGAEALLRWNSRDLQIVSPKEFIPIAEETGLIQELGQWVLRTVCQQSLELHEINPELRLAVNLSARQFYSLKPHEEMLRILQDLAVKTHCLELEITERVLVDNPAIARTKLNAFKTLGIKIAVDDFGTGYSSLQYLQDLPIDILKIDYHFVHEVDQNPKNAVIVRTLISLARQLNLDVVAEGVETKEELQFLRLNHCQEAQGYLLGRPMTFKQFKEKI